MLTDFEEIWRKIEVSEETEGPATQAKQKRSLPFSRFRRRPRVPKNNTQVSSPTVSPTESADDPSSKGSVPSDERRLRKVFSRKSSKSWKQASNQTGPSTSTPAVVPESGSMSGNVSQATQAPLKQKGSKRSDEADEPPIKTIAVSPMVTKEEIELERAVKRGAKLAKATQDESDRIPRVITPIVKHKTQPSSTSKAKKELTRDEKRLLQTYRRMKERLSPAQQEIAGKYIRMLSIMSPEQVDHCMRTDCVDERVYHAVMYELALSRKEMRESPPEIAPLAFDSASVVPEMVAKYENLRKRAISSARKHLSARQSVRSSRKRLFPSASAQSSIRNDSMSVDMSRDLTGEGNLEDLREDKPLATSAASREEGNNVDDRNASPMVEPAKTLATEEIPEVSLVEEAAVNTLSAEPDAETSHRPPKASEKASNDNLAPHFRKEDQIVDAAASESFEPLEGSSLAPIVLEQQESYNEPAETENVIDLVEQEDLADEVYSMQLVSSDEQGTGGCKAVPLVSEETTAVLNKGEPLNDTFITPELVEDDDVTPVMDSREDESQDDNLSTGEVPGAVAKLQAEAHWPQGLPSAPTDEAEKSLQLSWPGSDPENGDALGESPMEVAAAAAVDSAGTILACTTDGSTSEANSPPSSTEVPASEAITSAEAKGHNASQNNDADGHPDEAAPEWRFLVATNEGLESRSTAENEDLTTCDDSESSDDFHSVSGGADGSWKGLSSDGASDLPSVEENERPEERVGGEGANQPEKYHRMLKMGIPTGAVVQKMRKDGCTDDSIAGVVGSEAMSESETSPQVSREKRQSQLVKLHWTPVQEKELSTKSIWNSAGDSGHDVDISDLEQRFQKKAAAIKIKTSSTPSESKKANILNLNRTNNVSISLKAFKNFTYTELADIMAFLDPGHRLAAEKIEFLRDLLPTTSESKAIAAYVGSEDKLSEAERWFVSISGVKRLDAKVAALSAMSRFNETLSDTMSKLLLVETACQEVMESERLCEILAMVLKIGNIMNEGSDNGGVAGFKFESLLRLSQTKSSDGNSTLLDFLVEVFEKKEKSETLEFITELPSCRSASRLRLPELSEAVRLLSNDAEGVQKELEALQSDAKSTSRALKPATKPKVAADVARANVMEMLANRGDSKVDAGAARSGLLAAIKARGTGTETEAPVAAEESPADDESVEGVKGENSVRGAIWRAETFLIQSLSKCKELDARHKRVVEACKELADYCCADGESGAITVLGILVQFSAAIDSSRANFRVRTK